MKTSAFATIMTMFALSKSQISGSSASPVHIPDLPTDSNYPHRFAKTKRDDNKFNFTPDELEKYRSLSKRDRREFLKNRTTT